MKRIVILIDGTWNKEGTTGNTNVAKVDINALIKRRAANGTVQRVRYHDGAGAYGDIFKKILGGAIGLGLKKIVLAASLSMNMKRVMRFTFSGSRAARTLHAHWRGLLAHRALPVAGMPICSRSRGNTIGLVPLHVSHRMQVGPTGVGL